MNEGRVFSDADVLAKLEELNVELVVIDDTLREERIAKDLSRADRSIIPVNLVYPPNYPEEPCILLEGLIGPSDALKVLARMEQIQSGNSQTTQVSYQQ